MGWQTIVQRWHAFWQARREAEIRSLREERSDIELRISEIQRENRVVDDSRGYREYGGHGYQCDSNMLEHNGRILADLHSRKREIDQYLSANAGSPEQST